jgi:hypothetical protein
MMNEDRGGYEKGTTQAEKLAIAAKLNGEAFVIKFMKKVAPAAGYGNYELGRIADDLETAVLLDLTAALRELAKSAKRDSKHRKSGGRWKTRSGDLARARRAAERMDVEERMKAKITD